MEGVDEGVEGAEDKEVVEFEFGFCGVEGIASGVANVTAGPEEDEVEVEVEDEGVSEEVVTVVEVEGSSLSLNSSFAAKLSVRDSASCIELKMIHKSIKVE